MLARSVDLPGDRNQDEALADSRMRHLAGGSTLALAHLLDIIGNGKIIPPTNPRAARQRLRVSLIPDALLELVRLSQSPRTKSCLLRHRAPRRRFVVIISPLGL
jgi:hypothetical protein